MARVRSVFGAHEVLDNLRAANGATNAGILRGLKRAGLHLQRTSQRLVPVDTGNLKNTAFTRQIQFGFGGSRGDVQVGYTANYALFVHEAPMKLRGHPRPRHQNRKGRRSYFWDPQGRAQNKFLEQPARTEREAMLATVRASAVIKLQ